MPPGGVFDQKTRTDSSPSGHDEGTFDFLNRVEGGYWQQIRDLMEEWFARLPSSAKDDVRSRLRSRDDRHFSAAFFELYLHESLVRGGFQVTCHPSVPNSSRAPDFLVESHSTGFYLEATSVSEPDLDWAASRRLARMHEALNRMESPHFFLSVEVDSVGASDINTRRLRAGLKQWLSGLDPDEVGKHYLQASRADAVPSRTWNDNGWTLTVSVIPKSIEARGKPGLRPLGMFGPAGAMSVDVVSPVRKALTQKGSAYGELGLPFIVAVRQGSTFPLSSGIAEALYGSLQVTITSGPDQEPSYSEGRAGDGFWLGNTTWRNKRVSGVLSATNLHPWSVASELPVLWHHPQCAAPIPAIDFWGRVDLVGSALQTTEALRGPSEHFGLPRTWPEGEPFED